MSRWIKCGVPSCVRVARTKGLCEAHYKRARYCKCGLDPERPIGGYIKKREKRLAAGWH